MSAQPALDADDPAFTERRVALVVGNADYGPKVGPLHNPAGDATDIAAALRDLGFEVTLKLDVDRDQLRRAVIDFGRSLREGGIGLFYFSGHAVQLNGHNYMIPLGANVENADYLGVETVDLEEVLARMGGADNRLNIVILDACRNNPYKGLFRDLTSGLAPTLAPSGTYVAYSAAPGQLALDGRDTRNSPYTAALLKNLKVPGLRVEDVFKRVRSDVRASTDGFQTPWTASSITGDFYFRLPERVEVKAEPPVMAGPERVGSPAPDFQVWSVIQNSTNPVDFETFAETFPDSVWVPFARNRLAKVTPGEEPEETVALKQEPAASEPPTAIDPTPVVGVVDHAAIERALGLSRDQQREVQFALAESGHGPGGIDGILGPRSREAIVDWQQAVGAEPTGYLTDDQLAALLDEVDAAALLDFPEQMALRQPGQVFRDCPKCPEMVVVPAGEFLMGSPPNELGRNYDEGPQHRVTIPKPFAVGKYEVTFAEWDACVVERRCAYKPDDGGRGRGDRPVINVSWTDAQEHVSYLKDKTGEPYRLPTEAEWEYAARAGTVTPFWTGSTISAAQANYNGGFTYGAGRKGEYRGKTTPVDTFAPNPWGLHDMHGNIWEWTEDCGHDNYDAAPRNGSAWTSGGDCERRVLRGGSWYGKPALVRSANRYRNLPVNRDVYTGFRVARTID